jgi:hypothetical protein
MNFRDIAISVSKITMFLKKIYHRFNTNRGGIHMKPIIKVAENAETRLFSWNESLIKDM